MEKKRKKQGNIGSKNGARRFFASKLGVVVFLLVLQIVYILAIYKFFRNYQLYWKGGALLITAFVVVYLTNKNENPAYKLAWIVLVMAVPLAGGFLYLFLAGNRTRRRFMKHANENNLDTFKYLPDDTDIQKEIRTKSVSAGVQSTYISKTAGFPVYKNTKVTYFSLGEENFERLKQELNKAKRFIFMEYFIIKEGKMWDEIKSILTKKAAEGVEVRLMYDDFGCSMSMPSRFIKEMEALNIQAVPFNPVLPILNLIQNNRDHRKITVIDGNVGFTGGINLADEYINETHPFGHWKDTGVMLEGEAVWNLTTMFLQNWKLMTRGNEEDYGKYAVDEYCVDNEEELGYVQPYGDTPVDEEIVGENIYLNMINKAKRYVYITTPYLIIDHEMFVALTLAAKSGIDVRIITPGIPDKKAVYMVTQSYYEHLVEAGVRIFQYTPGFIHAKTVVCDDVVATVGTINFDYRSLYLHFECGVFMFKNKVIEEIRQDYEKTLEKCDEVLLEDLRKNKGIKRIWQSILRLFAPLM